MHQVPPNENTNHEQCKQRKRNSIINEEMESSSDDEDSSIVKHQFIE